MTAQDAIGPTDDAQVHPADVLASLRPLVLVVDGLGAVRSAYGGFGGFLGHDVDALVGQSVFDFLAPGDAAELAHYFLESSGEAFDTVSLPLPFRVGVVGGDGLVHPVDVIVAGRDEGGGTWSWVATLVPSSLQATMSRPLDALVERQPRDRVKELLTEEIVVDNAAYSSRGFLVELAGDGGVVVTTSRTQDRDIGDAITELVGGGWCPWRGVRHAETVALAVDELPDPLRSLVRSRGWRRATTTPVWLYDELIAAYLLLGSVPDAYPVEEIKANSAARYRHLARLTALVMGGWRDRDRLEWVAAHDALTGLANRHVFDAAVASAAAGGLLFIDVDDFKAVNDEYGHQIGDDVLSEVARRIRSACGERDLAARIGGDEFAVLVAGNDGSQLAAVADSVSTAVSAPWRLPNGPAHVAVSVGVVPEIGTGDAVALGSDAMRRQKRRNTAVCPQEALSAG